MGKPGYITLPSAEWFDNKPLGLAMAYVPKEYSSDILGSASTPEDLNTINMFSVRAGLTSFMDVNLSIAYRPLLKQRIGIGDRQFDFRFRLLKEKNNLPSIVLGWTPPGSRSPVLAHDYLVVTKNFGSGIGIFQLTAGYGSPYILWRDKEDDNNFWKSMKLKLKSDFKDSRYLSGFFGGMKYTPFDFGGLMLEYNTQTINAGAFINIKDWLYIQGTTYEGKEWALNMALHFSLTKSPITLRKYEKQMD
jgi:hypothetical protein